MPSRTMTQLFNGINFVYRSVEVNYTGDLPHYVLDRLSDNLMDKSY